MWYPKSLEKGVSESWNRWGNLMEKTSKSMCASGNKSGFRNCGNKNVYNKQT